jgi:hypothetical protein
VYGQKKRVPHRAYCNYEWVGLVVGGQVMNLGVMKGDLVQD